MRVQVVSAITAPAHTHHNARTTVSTLPMERLVILITPQLHRTIICFGYKDLANLLYGGRFISGLKLLEAVLGSLLSAMSLQWLLKPNSQNIQNLITTVNQLFFVT